MGTHFIREIMDECSFLPPPEGAGNLLQMTKTIERPPMTMQISEQGGVAVVALDGDVDLQHSPKVRKGLLDLLGAGRAVVVDMARVTYIDSSGVASLVEAFQTARKTGLAFALAGVSPAALRVLQLARLDRVFAIHASLDEAL
ncbi:MAG: STAS domain-containing protein, partial [Alphaproteobacteria bacterium]|nr:STAS domain-containing protein [Alphaproteobacteria bacterium]